MSHQAQGSAHQAGTLQGPAHTPKPAQHDDARFYLPALPANSGPTHPQAHEHHLAAPAPEFDHTTDGFRANSADDDVDALFNSALAAYAAGARAQGADQLALVRAAANAVGLEQQQEGGHGQHERGHGYVAGRHGTSSDEVGSNGAADEQGLFLPQLPVPPPSFNNVHPAPAPAALPSPPPTSASTSTAAVAPALASTPSSSSAAAAAPPTSAAPLPSSTSSAPAPPAPALSRGRGPGSRARWSASEDVRLVHLVRVVPPLTWNEIGAEMGRAPTGCSMRWYKFLRDRVARGEMGPGAAPTGAAGVAQGPGELEPSSEMVVGGSAGATMQAQAQDDAGGAGEGSLQVVDSPGPASSTSPSSASPTLTNGTAKARPLRKPTSSALPIGRPAAHVEPIEPSALPPPLPPSETLPGHPYPLKEGTKLHSNAGKGYLPRDAMVAKPPVPFQPHTVLRGRRTQKAVPLPLPETATVTATAAGATAEGDSTSPAGFALPLPPPPPGVAASAPSSSSALSFAPPLKLSAGPSTSTSTATASPADPTAPSSATAPAPTSLSPSTEPAVPAPGPPPKKGKGSKGGLSKAQASVHACPAEHCTAAFKRSEHLRRHYKSVHRGEKPFPCTVAGCGKTFSRKDNLQQHQAMVHLVRARYTYPDGSSSNDPPEAGTDAARLVVISFDEVDVARPGKAGASGADQDGGAAAGAGAKAKKKRQKKGERTPAVVAQAQGRAHAQPPSQVPAQGVDAQAWRAVVPGAAQYSVAPSASPSVEPGEAGEGGEGDDARAPSSSSAKRPRERSAASAPGSRRDGDDAHWHDDDRIDKRLRLTGLAGQDDDALDPALQVLAAQAQAQAHAHAHDHARGARSITPSSAFALTGTHALAHAPIVGSTSSSAAGSTSTSTTAADAAAQEYYARIARQLQGGRRTGGGGGEADMLVQGDVGEGGAGAAAGASAGGLAEMYVPGLEAFLDGQLGVAQRLDGELGGQGGGQ